MNKFDVPYLFAIKIQDKSQEDIDEFEKWIAKAFAAGIGRDAIVKTMAGSGWPGGFVKWYVGKHLPPPADGR